MSVLGFCLNEIEVYETVRNKSIKLKVEELIQHQVCSFYDFKLLYAIIRIKDINF
jgi:hypothetical protein